jgi:hypothetical protein
LNQHLEAGRVAEALRGLAASHMSFFAALEHAQQLGDPAVMCQLVRYLASYWARAGAFSRATAWVGLAAEHALALPEIERGWLLLALGYYGVASARPVQTHLHANEALALALRAQDEPLAARASLLLSGSAAAIGKPETGIESLKRTQAYALSIADQDLLHKARINLGVCFLQTGDVKAGRAQWQACDARFENRESQVRVSAVSNLALAAHYRGELAHAQQLCELALKLERSGQPQPSRVLHILLRQTWMLICNDQPREAQQVLARVRALSDLASLPNVQELLVFQRGKIDACLGNLDAAAAQLAGAVSEQPGRADPWDLLDSRVWLFWALHQQNVAKAVTGDLLRQLLGTVSGWRQEQPRVLEAAAAWFCAASSWPDAQHAWQSAQAQRAASGIVRFAVEQMHAEHIEQALALHVQSIGETARSDTGRTQHGDPQSADLLMQMSARVDAVIA